jgi:LuxR family transcriptional regulator, maltose regulon positive regulatory protein
MDAPDEPMTRLTPRAGQGARGTTARLSTRLPVVPDAWVDRPRLLARLDVAIERPVTLVIAPPGAGKTVTLAHWAHRHTELKVRWLNARHVDVAMLCRELLACTGVRGTDAVTTGDTVEEMIARVGELLASRRARDLLVIDDAHRLPHSCYVLLDELLNSCPDAVHLVLLSRWDPPLPMLLLEIQRTVTVIRGHQLRMTPAEARSLVELHAGSPAQPLVDSVVEYAQGWAAVLVLAGQTLRKAPSSIPYALESVAENGLGLVDLLVSQVFASLNEQQRHLLLCVSSEDTVTPAVARRLCGDARSGEVLEDLERVGLLVGREPQPAGHDDHGQVHFRLHPLLVEVLRRRFATGGVEVMRARAVVLKAASLSRAHGDVEAAMRRMLWVRAMDEAADLVAEHGLQLLATGRGDLVRRLCVAAPDAVDSCPRTWLAMAYERRRQGDHARAAHWGQRVLAWHAQSEPGEGPDEFELALVHLLRGATGEDDLEGAVDEAQRLLQSRPVPISYPRRALLLVELGAAETWLGHLAAAAGHLSAAVAMCRSGGFTDLYEDALSRLAAAELLQGGTLAARDAAQAVLDSTGSSSTASAAYRNRAVLVLELARQQTLPGALEPPGRAARPADPREFDMTYRLLGSVLAARVAEGNDGSGRNVLNRSLELPIELPEYMATLLDLERCGYAIAAGDVIELRTLAARLAPRDATVEAACLDAVVADMETDLGRAEEILTRVLHGDFGSAQTSVASLATVYLAQVADARGRREVADRVLLDAVRSTEPQRYAVPFVGWSTHGSPVPVLLRRLRLSSDSAWLAELAEAFGQVDARARVSPAAAGPGGDATRTSDAPAVIPALTRRESDVLFALAHGSSYADIAESLVITENTVKTHVSSLYAKLGVTRRSHALRAARAARLI